MANLQFRTLIKTTRTETKTNPAVIKTADK